MSIRHLTKCIRSTCQSPPAWKLSVDVGPSTAPSICAPSGCCAIHHTLLRTDTTSPRQDVGHLPSAICRLPLHPLPPHPPVRLSRLSNSHCRRRRRPRLPRALHCIDRGSLNPVKQPVPGLEAAAIAHDHRRSSQNIDIYPLFSPSESSTPASHANKTPGLSRCLVQHRRSHKGTDHTTLNSHKQLDCVPSWWHLSLFPQVGRIVRLRCPALPPPMLPIDTKQRHSLGVL